MKIDKTLPISTKEPFPQTDIEDSELYTRPKQQYHRRKAPRIRKSREVVHGRPEQMKLFRFPLARCKRTLRVPCFQEELLNLPLRFTRKLNQMEVDNDVETDEELAGREVERCKAWLMQAVQQQNHPQS